MGSDLLTTIQRMRGAPAEPPPVNPLLAASILATSTVRKKGVLDRAVEEQAKAESEMVTTLKGDKLSIKNMPMRDVVGNAVTDVAQSGAQIEELLKGYGLVTRPDQSVNDPAILDGVRGYREGYRASREIGNDPIMAAVHGLRVKFGGISSDEAVEAVRNERGLRNLERLQKVLPAENAIRSEQRIAGNADKQEDIDRRATLSRLSSLVTGTNFADTDYDSPEAAAEDMAVQAGTSLADLPQGGAGLVARIRNKTVMDQNKRRTERLSAFRSQPKAHMSRESVEQIARSYGADDTEMRVILGDYEGEVVAEQRRAAAAERAEERWAKTLAGKAEKPDKPVKIPAWQAKDLSVDSLLAAQGDETVDQPHLGRIVQARYGEMLQERQKLNARHQQVIREHALTSKRLAVLDAKLEKDEYVPNAETSRNQLEREKIALESEAYGINQRLRPIIENMQKVEAQTQPVVVQGRRGAIVKDGDKLVYRPKGK